MDNEIIKHAILKLKEDEIILFQYPHTMTAERVDLHCRDIERLFRENSIKIKFIMVADTNDVKTMSYDTLSKIRDKINDILDQK